MSSSRRSFLALTGLGGAAALLPARAWAGPAPARSPAPPAAPASADAGVTLLTTSRLPADEALLRAALDGAKKAGASYADARLVLWRRERVGVRDDHVSGIGRSEDYGLGLRVLVDGAWGFAATAELKPKSIEQIVKAAAAIARRNAMLMPKPVTLVPTPVVQGGWVSPFTVDPFSIGAAEKAELLLAAARAALKVPGVAHVDASVACLREEKLLLTSEGSRIHQICFRVAPGLTATAIDRRRGRFESRDHEVMPMLAGWEHVTATDLVGSAPQIADDVLHKLHAAPVAPGKKHVILAPSNLWLTIHESIGHSTELDRALGLEANLAGTSFLTTDKTGKFRIGTELVNIAADRTQPGGLATVGWDDEAVASQRWDLVKDGIFVGWQTTRDLAAAIGETKSRGCCYADSYASVPFARMPNVSLQPGRDKLTTEDLIAATDDGVLISGRGSWSIDQQRYNF
jgi:TldD protein